MATITFSMASTPLTASKVYTSTDSDMQDLLNWGKARYAANLPPNPTNAQIALAIVQDVVNQWITAVQNFKTQPIVIPPPSGWQ